ncbi:MAG: hypothetical protein MI919_32355, partial [Holophagales bacterium]|nr:hypothetical protein [Holophagales bacterium]
MPFELTAEQTQQILDRLFPIALALVILTVGWALSKWSHALVLGALRKGRLDEAVSRFLASFSQWAVLALAGIAALEKAGVETTSLAAIVAAVG